MVIISVSFKAKVAKASSVKCKRSHQNKMDIRFDGHILLKIPTINGIIGEKTEKYFIICRMAIMDFVAACVLTFAQTVPNHSLCLGNYQ